MVVDNTRAILVDPISTDLIGPANECLFRQRTALTKTKTIAINVQSVHAVVVVVAVGTPL